MEETVPGISHLLTSYILWPARSNLRDNIPQWVTDWLNDDWLKMCYPSPFTEKFVYILLLLYQKQQQWDEKTSRKWEKCENVFIFPRHFLGAFLKYPTRYACCLKKFRQAISISQNIVEWICVYEDSQGYGHGVEEE